MDLATIDLDAALKLLSLPRVVGTDAEGVEITAQNGRYGPYLKKGTDSRSLVRPSSSSSTSPSRRRSRSTPSRSSAAGPPRTPPLKELGDDPVSGKPVVVKDGRFGPYVTDGETNATLRKDDDPAVDHARAWLRAARREARQGPDDPQARREEDGQEGAREAGDAKKATTKKA